MRVRRVLLLAAVIIGLSGLSIPANAAPAAPAFGPLDWSTTPGHVLGTVTATADASYVYVDLGYGGSWPGPNALIALDPVTHTAGFDLLTWGFGQAQVGAEGCTDGTLASCGAMVTSATFAPTNVTPSITWPTDSKIGPGDPTDVTVSDPQGSGSDLLAVWVPASGARPTTLLAHSGATTLNLSDGDGVLYVHRCMAGSQFQCTGFSGAQSATPISHGLAVHRDPMTATVDSFSTGRITPLEESTYATIQTDRHGAASLDWFVTENGTPVDGTGGHFDATTDGSGRITVPVQAAGLPTGTYGIGGSLTVVDPDYGSFTSPVNGALTAFQVDRTGPAITSVDLSRSVVYPLTPSWGRLNVSYLNVEATSNAPQWGDRIVEFVDSAGKTAYKIRSDACCGWYVNWDGRTYAGTAVAAGAYTIRIVDGDGNSTDLSQKIYVSHQKATIKTFTKTVSAAGSIYRKHIGRCSTLASPSSHGWRGSLGYYSNSKCSSQRGDDSVAEVVHQVRVPQAWFYGTVKVDVYGGAARHHQDDVLGLWYINAQGYGGDFHKPGPTVGLHKNYAEWPRWEPGPEPTIPWVNAQHMFRWSAGTGDSTRYDVKYYTVTVKYAVMQ